MPPVFFHRSKLQVIVTKTYYECNLAGLASELWLPKCEREVERTRMNEIQTPPPNRKKRYDLNFKRSAVELWLSSNKSAKAVATEPSISGQTLKTWKQQISVPPPSSTAQTWSNSRKRTVGCGAS